MLPLWPAHAVRVELRWMRPADLDQVAVIEASSFTEPLTAGQFEAALRARRCFGVVAVRAGAIVGFMLYVQHRRSFEVLNMAVAPAWRRSQVGAQLVQRLLAQLQPDERWTFPRTRVLALVRETLLSAQCFFRALGFRADRVRRGYYEDGLDAFRFVYPPLPSQRD